ncbi:helix-turn-helix domain-containing protein [Kineosporia sp. A_224]|uniref:helix-turn-helix domain-containing protein n=1 Tax=Kineosporia sp. A_224 TaxID=1962180 RepID=UPI00350F0B3F
MARLRAQHPDLSTAEIARRLGVTDRTVRRHLAAGAAPAPVGRPDGVSDGQGTARVQSGVAA